jgi:two-component system cell cycle sensor histidine kinase/response regulator CckA
MGTPLRVLFVEDQEDDVALVLRELRRCGYDIPDGSWKRVQTDEALVAALRKPGSTWDLVVSDFSMPSFTGPEALALCKERGVEMPFIIVSGTVDEEQAVTALRAGARDFIHKGNLARLGPAVARELHDHAERVARRKAEAQLLQAQKMDAVGQLAGGVAHDLNNILGVIMGQAEIVIRQTDAADPRSRRLNGICEAADRAAALVRQLLAFSRRQVIQPTVVDVNQVVSGTVEMLGRIVGEDIAIHCRLASDLWRVKADVAQLEQVVMNLVINARDAMPGGGTLTIETRNTSPTASAVPPPGDYVRLDITDTGHGMDEETVARMFEPFFTTKEPGKGTGLGLATVYGIVTQAGGHIDVESAPGRGTAFRILLPRTQSAARAAAAPKAVVESRAGHETILLVEDDVALRLLLREILEEAGYRILAAEAPEEALDIANTYGGEIHLLLTDVVLPRMRGTAVAASVVAARPRAHVLFMSGYSAPRGPKESPVTPLLVKPFTAESLLTAVRRRLTPAEA